jgi:thioredoxin 1
MSELIKSISDSEFNTLVLQEANLPVLVDFWAPWCGPCRMIAPILELVAEEYKDRLIICKVDVDQNPESPAKYKVMGIPNLILFKNGAPVANKTGSMTKSELVSFLNQYC